MSACSEDCRLARINYQQVKARNGVFKAVLAWCTKFFCCVNVLHSLYHIDLWYMDVITATLNFTGMALKVLSGVLEITAHVFCFFLLPVSTANNVRTNVVYFY